MKFQESALAHELLDGLRGIEIGGAAHNAFGLDTLNVDRAPIGAPEQELYAEEQRQMCGEVMPVDIVANGDQLPFADDSFDFVLSSHVIEHFYDPIAALEEWARVARRYVFIICPQRDALPDDVDKPLTPLAEHRQRHREPPQPGRSDVFHHSRWTAASFERMCRDTGFEVIASEDPDRKVGNGFTIVIGLDAQHDRAAGTAAAVRRVVGRVRSTASRMRQRSR